MNWLSCSRWLSLALLSLGVRSKSENRFLGGGGVGGCVTESREKLTLVVRPPTAGAVAGSPVTGAVVGVGGEPGH